jgi:hypothetical protein
VTNSRRCEVAAFVLCFLHILTVGGMAYQGPLASDYDKLVINYGLWLSPILVVILIRRYCALVGVCAIPILIDFAARMYYIWYYYSFGVTLGGPKGDWALWLTTFMAMFSIVIVPPWLLISGGIFIANLINRSRGAKGDR